MDRFGELAPGDVDEWQRDECHECEPRVGGEQDHGDGGDHREVGQRDRDHHDEGLDLGRSLDDRLISWPVCDRSW